MVGIWFLGYVNVGRLSWSITHFPVRRSHFALSTSMFILMKYWILLPLFPDITFLCLFFSTKLPIFDRSDLRGLPFWATHSVPLKIFLQCVFILPQLFGQVPFEYYLRLGKGLFGLFGNEFKIFLDIFKSLARFIDLLVSLIINSFKDLYLHSEYFPFLYVLR